MKSDPGPARAAEYDYFVLLMAMVVIIAICVWREWGRHHGAGASSEGMTIVDDPLQD